MLSLKNNSANQQYIEQFIKEYCMVSSAHLDKIMQNANFSSKKRSSYHSALRNFSVANYDKSTKYYFSSSYVTTSQQREYEMDKILWVIIDFLERVDNHFLISNDFVPALACMMIENRAYEIVYARKGNEPYIDQQLTASRLELLYRAESSFFSPIVENSDTAILNAVKYIILMEDISNAHLIHSKQVAYFCVLDEANNPKFFAPEEISETDKAGDGDGNTNKSIA